MIVEWLKLFMVSSGSLVGVYIVFGMLMNMVEQLNAQMIFRSFGYLGIVMTGFIGTVVHEFSHFIMCILFRFQVTEVAWFRPIGGMSDGELGHVHYIYNTQSLVQQIGNFFVGIAPLIIGSLVILLLYHICLPKSAKKFTTHMNQEMISMTQNFTVSHMVQMMFREVSALLSTLFTKENFKKPIFWIFLLAMYSISSHMSLSPADVKGASVGLIALLGIILIITFLMTLVRLPIKKCAGLIIKYNVLVISIFSVGLSFSLLTLLISWAFQLIFA